MPEPEASHDRDFKAGLPGGRKPEGPASGTPYKLRASGLSESVKPIRRGLGEPRQINLGYAAPEGVP